MGTNIDSFIGEGTVWVDRWTDAGAKAGLVKLGNATKFSMKSEAEIKEQISRQKGTYGQVVASVVLPKPGKFSMTIDQMDRNVFAMVFLGSDSDLSVTGAAVTDEAVAAAALDKGVSLAHRFIDGTAAFTVTDETGMTTYTEGTDYEVNRDLGLLTPLSGGGIAEADGLLVSYTYATREGYKIEGMTRSAIIATLVLEGRNFFNQSDCIVTVDKVRLMPSSEVDFLSPDFLPVQLDGSMETLPGSASPFRVEYFRA